MVARAKELEEEELEEEELEEEELEEEELEEEELDELRRRKNLVQLLVDSSMVEV